VLRQFRRVSAAERAIVQEIIDDLRPVDYKATGTLQRGIDSLGRLSRNEFEGLLDAMVRAGLIEIEGAEFEKDGESIRFRKVRLTDLGLDVRPTTPLALLISDGIVHGLGGAAKAAAKSNKPKAPAKTAAKKADAGPVQLSVDDEALATRLREWRAAEAKRLRVPAYVVLHDRTLTALAKARPENPRQLLEIDGMGPAKVEKFGEAILGLCGAQ
jgi:superfamily II DNA helicase RecQ